MDHQQLNLQCNSEGRNWLTATLSHNFYAGTRILLDRNFPLNERDANEDFPLHVLLRGAGTASLSGDQDEYMAILEKMLNGVELDDTNAQG